MTKKTIVPQSKKKRIEENSVYHTLKFFFILLLFTGYLPVQGIFSCPEAWHFKWISWPTFYSLYMFCLASIMCMFQLYHYFVVGKNDIPIQDMVSIITAVLSIIFFIRLARKWPELIQKWSILDEKFNLVYGYPKFLKMKLSLATIIYTIFTFGEYFFFVFVTCIYDDAGTNLTFQQLVEEIYYYIFSYVPYHILWAVILALPSVSTYMALSLIDGFVIVMSIVLSSRFQQINQKLKQHKKNNSVNFWITLRRNYSEMGNLCSDINEKISNIILLSYGSNMILLLIQLRTFISNEVEKEAAGLYAYSFLFLVIRLFGVYFFSSKINGESRKPIRILFSVSTETYNVEIRRWYMQMKLDNIALTGSNLFKITPGLILSIASAIVTYELIVIQFSEPK